MNCRCGHAAGTAAQLTDHLGEMFTPGNDIAPDGRMHAEAVSDPARPGWRCVCGFAARDILELDAHLVVAFTPSDGIGADGRVHG